MDAEKLRVAREKLTRVFRYLEALNQHRNPAKRQLREQPWTLWMRDLSDHASVQRGAARASASKAKAQNGQTMEDPSYIRLTAHWKIGTFRIDLVVEGDGKRLAIECDGDRHQPLERLSEDMDRQSVLERMGWIFTRIRGSEFLRNPARAMKSIFEKLEALEIPSAGKTREIQEGPSSHEVIDQLIRRAEELRKTWPKTNGVGARSSASAAAKV